MFELSKDMFNPSFPGHCDTHGDCDFMHLELDACQLTVCVRCINEAQLRAMEAQNQAMRDAGHIVEEVTFVSTDTYPRPKET